MRPRLSEGEMAVLIDSLDIRIQEAKKILFQHRNELTWNRAFRLEKAIAFMERVKRKLESSLSRYAKTSWNTETPIIDLILRKELKLEW